MLAWRNRALFSTLSRFMNNRMVSVNRSFLAWALLAGLAASVFAMSLQFDLWIERGKKWNGSFAAMDSDEPFYAAYVQSLIDGKSRRNSPYTGMEDSSTNPQRESYLSIQILASYPTVVLAKVFGLSSSTAMIWLLPLIGFTSALAVFWIIHIVTEDPLVAFVGTMTVLMGGAAAGGQGGILSFITPENVHYTVSSLFARRSVPAMSLPALLLFFVFVWKFVNGRDNKSRFLSGLAVVACFAFSVYGYFFHWTTAMAWFVGFLILWSVLRYEDLKKNWKYLLLLIVAFVTVLIPYFLLLLNRSHDTDSELMLSFTHQPDLSRIPTLISFVTIGILIILRGLGKVKLGDPKIVFLISFAVVAPIVFNQQIVTGRSLQPFHYQLYSVNYLALLGLSTAILILIKRLTDTKTFYGTTVFIGLFALTWGYVDSEQGAQIVRGVNEWRDELVPVALRIKDIHREMNQGGQPKAVLSFDFTNRYQVNSTELPSISSLPVVWSPYDLMFPDVSKKEALERLFRFLYFHNYDENWMRTELSGGDNLMLIAVFGGIRSNDPTLNDSRLPKSEEIDEVVNQYKVFRQTFGYENARSAALGFVIVQKDAKTDLSALDLWYERDGGEIVGQYTLYRVKLREDPAEVTTKVFCSQSR